MTTTAGARRQPSSGPAETSASNAIFLIGFGMFLSVAFLPAFLAALARLLGLVGLVALAAAATNPTDRSFAQWIRAQDGLERRLPPPPTAGGKASVKSIFSAVVKTAIAMVTNEPVTWQFHNLVICSVVHVPASDRYALGVAGSWRWVDPTASPQLHRLCQAPWIARFTNGGVASGLARYAATADGESPPPTLPRAPPANELERAANSFAAAVGDLAAGALANRDTAESHTATGAADRELRARAIQAKIAKDWRTAARLFHEASFVALSLLSRTNYQLEAAWCELEDASITAFVSTKTRLTACVDEVCKDLANAGYVDEAARALAEFALRLKRRFAACIKADEQAAMDVAGLYARAQQLAEKGGHIRHAIDHGLRASAIYAEAALWALAEEGFDGVAHLQLREEDYDRADESFANAVLTRIAQLDVVGADQLFQVNRKTLRDAVGGRVPTSDLDALLENVFEAYEKWSVDALDTSIATYERHRRLVPWQHACLTNLRQRIDSTDLR